MIVDVRRYTLRPGQLAPYLALYGEGGYAAQARHLGPALGWFVSDVGPQNQVIHLWGYKDMADLDLRRRAMASDPEWAGIRDGMKGLFEDQETRLMSAVEGLPYIRSPAAPGLVDIRIYTLHHGVMPDFLAFLRTHAAPIQARHWPDNLAYLVSQTGPQNQVMHVWGHADHSERLARRARLLADPEWQDCLKSILPRVKRMETLTATPAPFWSRPGEG